MKSPQHCMTYPEQLQNEKWKEKRETIIKRDNNRCTQCDLERSQLLSLSYKFGIKSFNEMVSDGYNFKQIPNSFDLHYSMKGHIMLCKNIGTPVTVHNFDDYHFALRWVIPKNPFALSTYKLVFFDKAIKDKEFYDLNVHHTYYKCGLKAWEYEADTLVTLCSTCHKNEHDKNDIPIYNSNGVFIDFAKNCGRCNGLGVLPEYRHVQQGLCFQCRGTGSVNIE